MPWVKIDDHFDEHPKLAAVGPIGWGVWLAGLAYCNRNLTDGFIPYSIAEGIGGAWLVRMVEDQTTDTGGEFTGERLWHIGRTSGMDGADMTAQWVVELLVEYGLWDHVQGGYQVHDYDDYQPTKAEILEDRAKKQAAGQAGGKASAQARGQAPAKAPAQALSKPVPVPDPVPPSSSKEDSGAAREDAEKTDALDAWYRLTGSWPTNKTLPWLNQLIKDHGDEAVCTALGQEWQADSTRHTILGRVGDRLKREAHEASKRRAEAKKRADEEERAKIASVPPETLAANRERLAEMMAAAGLIKKAGH